MGEAQQNRPEDLDDRCLAKYGVLDNRFGQNPCEVARVLLDMCSPRAYYSLPALDLVNNQTHYPSPNPGQVRPSSSSLREPLNLVERELTSCAPSRGIVSPRRRPSASARWASTTSCRAARRASRKRRTSRP